MKCEHCGKNEVTFVYQSNINGQVTEKHLCADCAAKLGFTQRIAASRQRMMNSFGSLFSDPFGGLSDGFDQFTVPRLSMPEQFHQMLGEMFDNPLDDLFADMPALGAPAKLPEKTPEKTEAEQADQNRFARTRELNALRHEMARAVETEDFERAAQLRDRIRALEKENS